MSEENVEIALGIDCDDSDGLLNHLQALGYKLHRTDPGCGVRPRRAQGGQRRAGEPADVIREGLECGVRASVAPGSAQRARDSRNERRDINLR